MPEENADLKGAQLLLVDDTPENLDVLCALLEAEGYDLALALDGPIALQIARRTRPDLVLLDIMMPGMDGYEVCRQLKADPELCEVPVVFITAKGQTEDIVEGFRRGGVDYVTKPIRDEEVLARVKTHLRLHFLRRELDEKSERLQHQNHELADKNRALEEEMAQRKKLKSQLSMISQREAEHWGLKGFIGQSPTMRRIFEEIRLMQENTTTSVLIAGESGTGKELVARAMHFGSVRRDGPFVPVNCASMPAELAESLLFGHVKGAFTGADSERIGYFELAHGGTLFLDEIGDMPLPLQAKLLRVLEDAQVWRVGAREGRAVDARVVSATNADLLARIQQGAFRQDLYFRLARFAVTAPPLRDRRADIPLLAQHFLQLLASEMGREAPDLSAQTRTALTAYAFPGNVRELKNIIERALIESRGGPIEPHHLHFMPGATPTPAAQPSTAPAAPDPAATAAIPAHGADGPLGTLEEREREHIRAVLEETNWVIRGDSGAAFILGIPESTLRGRIKRLGIQRSQRAP